ncbi:hypothetical protein EDD15DRAFT_2194887 [Pisolithus albus]|nr:hypothetical protein EDD15DRAFT_2194887 [Pisolithus albus]
MPPTTRPQNKTKHPGLPDLPVVAQEATLPPGSGSGAKLQLKAKSRNEHDTITKQVKAVEADLLTQWQQARSTARQPPGPSQATGKGDKSSTRKWQPTSEEESEVVDKRKTRPRKKQKGSTGEETPATTQTGKATDVQKTSKAVVGKSTRAAKTDHSYAQTAGSGRATRSTVGSQVIIGSNVTEQTDAHTRSNPTGASPDNDTTGVDNDLNRENRGEIVSRRQPEATWLKSNATRVPDVGTMGREVDEDAMSVVVDEEENAECARPGTMSHQNGKGNSPHERASHSLRSPFPVVGLIPNWCSTAHPLSTQSQPKPKTSNSKPGSQHRIARSTSNPNGALQAGYKSSYGGLSDGDDANDVRAQVSHISSTLLSPRPSPFHLTPSAPANVPGLDAVVERVEHENEREYQTADCQVVSTADLQYSQSPQITHQIFSEASDYQTMSCGNFNWSLNFVNIHLPISHPKKEILRRTLQISRPKKEILLSRFFDFRVYTDALWQFQTPIEIFVGVYINPFTPATQLFPLPPPSPFVSLAVVPPSVPVE